MIIEGETPKYGRVLAKQMEAFMVDSSYLEKIWRQVQFFLCFFFPLRQ